MTSTAEIKEAIQLLSQKQLKDLYQFIAEIMSINIPISNLDKEIGESRFANGEACVHCGSTAIVKYGRVRRAQRYRCKDCGKTFNTLTFSSLSYSKLPLDLWVHYAQCLISGYSIRKSAKAVGVCVKTSFYMRHKLLDCIRAYIGVGHVEGIIELDETMVAESFKGNHKKSGFILPRKPRKRGGEIHTRGISNEYICIASAIDRHGNIILEAVCKGRITHTDLEKLFTNHIDTHSIICSDSHKSYIQFAKNLSLEHKQIPRGFHKNGIYHINRVNSLHSRFKQWLAGFKGVSTKYLPNYLSFFKLVELIKGEKEPVQNKNTLLYGTSGFFDVRISNFRIRTRTIDKNI